MVYALSTLALRPGEMGRRTGFALSVGSLGAFLGGSAQAALLTEQFHWARPVGLFAVCRLSLLPSSNSNIPLCL